MAAAEDEDEGEAKPGVAAEAPTRSLPPPPPPPPPLVFGRRLLTAGGRWEEPTVLPTLTPLELETAAEERAFSHTGKEQRNKRKCQTWSPICKPFHKFGASKSATRRSWTTWNSPIYWSWCFKTEEEQVANLKCSLLWKPNRTFHNFRAQICLDWRLWLQEVDYRRVVKGLWNYRMFGWVGWMLWSDSSR